ncbi:MAG: hypothetical protein H6Q20_2235 [Bacteroidetes bacterium]|nr:hypothetical protein [Bacteroidota bacterium]
MKKVLCFIFFSLHLSVCLFASEIIQNPTLVKGKLGNGLTYYIYPNSYPKGEAVYRLFIKSGSVNELESQKGLAHFLEHMAFNGSEHFPGNSLVRFLESRGAKFGKDLNAHTSFNETVYKLQLPVTDKAMVDSTLTILSDWAGGLLLDSVEIEDERGVIMSEWLSKTGPQADVNNALLLDLLNKSRFAERIVIGDTAVIKNFKRREILDYYRKWYNPNLMAVAVVGDVNPAEIEKLIQEKFGKLRGAKLPEKNYSIPDYAEQQARIIIHSSLAGVELNMMQLMPLARAVKNEKDYPDYLAALMLNRLMKARLNALSFDNPAYKKASIGMSDFLNTKRVLMSTVELDPAKIREGVGQFSAQLNQMFRYGFLKHEIEKQKRIYLNQMKRKVTSKSPQRSDDLMNEIYAEYFKGNVVTSSEEEYRLLKKYITRIDSASMVRMFRKLVRPEKTHFMMTSFSELTKVFPDSDSLLRYVNAVSKEPVKRYAKNLDQMPDELLESEPVAGTLVRQISIPEINAQELELSNGVKVIFKRSVTDKDKISLSAFRAGGAYALAPADYVTGLVAGNVVGLSGAGRFSREALSHFLAGNSASARFLIDKTRSGVVGGANLQDMETLFQLMYLKWTEPGLDTLVFNQTKEKSIQAYITANKTDETRFYEDFGRLLKEKDYTTRELTDTVINTELKIDRILPVYNSSFGKATGYSFVIMADCELNELMPYVLKYIGGLPAGDFAKTYVYDGGKVRTTAARLQRKAGDSPKAVVSLVFQQNNISQDLSVFNLQNQMLAEVLKMKLLKELREKLGMVYSFGVSSGATLYPSPLSRNTISFKCLPENVDTLITQTVKIIHEMEKLPQSFEPELNDVKANLIKTMLADRQKDSFWSTAIRNKIYNNESNWSFVSDYDDMVNSLSAEQLARLITLNFNTNKIIQSILIPKN